MLQHAADERHDFCATLRDTPPDAPTLCGDWTAAQLVAHLILRERSLREAGGRMPSEKLRTAAAAGIDALVRDLTYTELVSRFEAGPPRYSPFRAAPVRELVNLLEYVVHHEDVRRVVDVPPRAMPLDRQRAVFKRLRLAAPLTMRRLPFGVRMVWPGQGDLTTKRGTVPVTVTGDPVELALIAFGRQGVAHAVYDGPDADVAVVSDTPLPV